jgi:hypothetical protein
MTAADVQSSREFCVFEFPGCEGCPKAMHLTKTVGSSEDPMKSMAWSGWIAGLPIAKSRSAKSGRSPMNEFIHQQNLDLLKKRLAEPHTDAERGILMKLLADEQAKEPPPTIGNLKQRESPVDVGKGNAVTYEIRDGCMIPKPAK